MCRLRVLQRKARSLPKAVNCDELFDGAVSTANLLCVHVVHPVFARVQLDFRDLKVWELPSRYAAAKVFQRQRSARLCA